MAIENREVLFNNLERIIVGEAADGSLYAAGTKEPTILDVYIAVIVQWSPRKSSENIMH